MIVLDTHVWVWWVHGDARLPSGLSSVLEREQRDRLLLSDISVWEVAKLVELKRLDVGMPLPEWFDQALAYPGIELVRVTPRIAHESTILPQPFHRDPADQIIVATARVFGCPLATVDGRICSYPHVERVV